MSSSQVSLAPRLGWIGKPTVHGYADFILVQALTKAMTGIHGPAYGFQFAEVSVKEAGPKSSFL